jgi:TonB-dependent starch-binding outer membrane protein SusC
MKKIIFLLLPVLLLTLAFNLKQTITVSGTVSDEKGNPISFAVVKLKTGKVAVQTNKNGFYSIVVPDPNATLVYSFIGYEIKEEKIKGRTVINVFLKQVSKALEEVVVTSGYRNKGKQALDFLLCDTHTCRIFIWP